MNAAQRKHYHGRLWPAACRAQGWDRRDGERRKAVTREAMRLCKGPATDSSAELDEAAVTALFAYLEHLADPENLRKLSWWMTCQEDPRAANEARQGDYWARKAGYGRKGRIAKERFKHRPYDGLYEESRMDRREAGQYLMTMRARAKRSAAKAADLRSEISDLKVEEPF